MYDNSSLEFKSWKKLVSAWQQREEHGYKYFPRIGWIKGRVQIVKQDRNSARNFSMLYNLGIIDLSERNYV